MIKNYLEFIKESDEINLGELVESLYDDDYIKNIVNRFLGEIPSTIRLSNAINLLDDNTKKDIHSQIEQYQQNGIEEKDPQIIVSTETEELLESENIAGKSIFTSFLKALTALGLKEKTTDNEKCPSHFLFFHYYPNLIAEDVKSIFSRFSSLSRYLEMIDYGKNETALYFGVRCDGTFEYGVAYDKLNTIGKFKLSASVVKWLINLESKSALTLKKQLVNLSFKDIELLNKIKTDMTEFNPGYHEKKEKPYITDRIITFSFYGVGKWDNGRLDEGELLNIKNNFTTWVLSKKWSQKVLISVKADSFTVRIHIKLK
jgi:hypothetical protein